MKTFKSLRSDLKTPVKKGEIMYAERSIGIARQNMPQIRNADVPEFLAWIEAQGHRVYKRRVLPEELHPTQYELNSDKIAALKDKHDQLSKVLIVSKDLYILDGHHRWGALARYYGKTPIQVEVVDTDIITLINLTKQFPGAFSKSIHEANMLQQERLDYNPSLGWWLDNDPVKFYHGTHHSKLASILENGLVAHGHGTAAGWVSLALDPVTAHSWAAMSGAGGESIFRNDDEPSTTPANERVVLELQIPQEFIAGSITPAIGAVSMLNYKLQNKATYEQEKAAGVSDAEYYAVTEVRLPSVSPKYITKIITK